MRGPTWIVCGLAISFGLFDGPSWARPLTSAIQQLQTEGAQSTPGRDGTSDAAQSAAQPAQMGPNFQSQNVELLGRVTPQQFATNAGCAFGATTVCMNDIWGYTSPSGTEYAIVGLYSGTGFVNISNPRGPVVVASFSDSASIWSDMSTLDHYAYNVNESGGGLQIFDLSQIDSGVVTQLPTYFGMQTSHTIWVNEASRYLYLAGSNLNGGRLIALDIDNPAAPVLAGQAIDGAYVHETEVITYTEGPYAGREIAFCYCGSAGLKIIDVTDKNNMFTMSTTNYPNRRYTHQGSITADRQRIYVNDELDEVQTPVDTATTYVFNVSNLSAPVLESTFTTGLPTIDHNLFVRGDFVFEANYTSGLRIFNIADPGSVFEAGWIDTYPLNNSMSFNGAWGTFVYYNSGIVAVSDMQYGLFILDVSAAEALTCPPAPAPQPAANANPKPRHLSVSFPPGAVQSALRVTVTAMPAEFSAFVGNQYWVDLPVQVPNQKVPGQNLWRARLSCSPVYANWSSYGTVQIGDDEIVPGAAYEVEPVALGCDPGGSSSTPLAVTTAPLWGDIVGDGGTGPPDGEVTVVDVASLVDVLKNLASSPDVAQSDLHPSEPDFIVNIIEVGSAVDALKGLPYPYPGPSACP